MKYLRHLDISVAYENHKYRLNWVDGWKDNIYLLGVTVLDFKTLGEPGQILFARRDGQQLAIIGQWGKGEIYDKYQKEKMPCEQLDT